MKKNVFGSTVFAFLISIFQLTIFAQERQVLPVDEAEKDPTFLQFRAKLISAVRSRDQKYVLSLVDPNIKNGFGGEDGIANFKKQWKISSPKSELWNELLTILLNGGTFYKEPGIKYKQFCAPYTFTSFPEDLDAFEYAAIFGNNVNLRARPDSSAGVVAQLSYNVVKVDYENSVKSKSDQNAYTWLKVETTGGKKGFVSADFVRSPIAYRACFEKKNGKWKMAVLLAGD